MERRIFYRELRVALCGKSILLAGSLVLTLVWQEFEVELRVNRMYTTISHDVGFMSEQVQV